MSGKGDINHRGVYDTSLVAARLPVDDVLRARLVVAGRSRDAADCRNLLELLGLLPDQQHAAVPLPVDRDDEEDRVDDAAALLDRRRRSWTDGDFVDPQDPHAWMEGLL